MSSKPQSPSTNLRAPPAMEGPKESIVSRLLITPLTFISFLLSLALIDSRNTNIRTQSHSPHPTTVLGQARVFLDRCLYKPTDTSPYSFVSETLTSTTRTKEDEKWYWHTKQRKMMKAEFSDAYRMRNSVLIFLLASAAMFGLGVVYAVREVVGWLRYI